MQMVYEGADDILSYGSFKQDIYIVELPRNEEYVWNACGGDADRYRMFMDVFIPLGLRGGVAEA